MTPPTRLVCPSNFRQGFTTHVSCIPAACKDKTLNGIVTNHRSTISAVVCYRLCHHSPRNVALIGIQYWEHALNEEQSYRKLRERYDIRIECTASWNCLRGMLYMRSQAQALHKGATQCQSVFGMGAWRLFVKTDRSLATCPLPCGEVSVVGRTLPFCQWQLASGNCRQLVEGLWQKLAEINVNPMSKRCNFLGLCAH